LTVEMPGVECPPVARIAAAQSIREADCDHSERALRDLRIGIGGI
jgi:hypothetical protein